MVEEVDGEDDGLEEDFVRKDPLHGTQVELVFSWWAWEKVRHLHAKAEGEIGWMGIAEDADRPLYITDIEVLPQTASWGVFDFDDGAMAEFLERRVADGQHPSQFYRVWGHKQPGTETPSGKDWENFTEHFFQECNLDWAVMFILGSGNNQAYVNMRTAVNKTGDRTIYVDTKIPLRVEGIRVDAKTTAEWDESLKLVKKQTYYSHTGHAHYPGSAADMDDDVSSPKGALAKAHGKARKKGKKGKESREQVKGPIKDQFGYLVHLRGGGHSRKPLERWVAGGVNPYTKETFSGDYVPVRAWQLCQAAMDAFLGVTGSPLLKIANTFFTARMHISSPTIDWPALGPILGLKVEESIEARSLPAAEQLYYVFDLLADWVIENPTVSGTTRTIQEESAHDDDKLGTEALFVG